MARRWKAKPKGIATVRRNGWWVPKDSTPAGGRPASQPRSAAVNRLPPRPFVGSEGLIGPWRSEPRLNPDEWEWAQNPENNRWFARPRNELTGLGSIERADIKGFDRQTAAQQQRISESYGTYAQQAAADAAAGAQNLGTLAKLSSAGFTDATHGKASGPYGAVTTGALSMAEQALPGVLAQGAREGSAAASAQTIAGLNQLPTLARSEGLTASERFSAERLGQRAERISGYREQAAEAEAARQELAAELRGQNLQHLGRVISGETQVKTAEIREKGKDKDRRARLIESAARLRQQAQIARERNLVSRANTLDRLAADREKAAAKEKQKRKLSASDLRQMTKRAREMWEGVPRTVTDDEGNKVTEYLQYDYDEIVRELMAMGAPRSRARTIATQVTGDHPVSPAVSSTVSRALRF